jgi:hypothetical protein
MSNAPQFAHLIAKHDAEQRERLEQERKSVEALANGSAAAAGAPASPRHRDLGGEIARTAVRRPAAPNASAPSAPAHDEAEEEEEEEENDPRMIDHVDLTVSTASTATRFLCYSLSLRYGRGPNTIPCLFHCSAIFSCLPIVGPHQHKEGQAKVQACAR